MSAKALVIYLDYHTESEKYFATIFMTTKYRQDDFGEDKFNPRHMSISLSFMSFFSYFNQKTFF